MIVALVPAYREQETVAQTVQAISGIHGVDQVIVVDDGSGDETAARAAAAGAHVVSLPVNRGKGAALEAGAGHLPDAVEIVLLLDADLGDSATQAERLISPVADGEADMTIATFPRPPGKAGFGLVKGLARWGIRRFGGPFEATAPLSGQRALSRAALDAGRPFASGYAVEAVLTIRVLRAGLGVREIETTMTHAHTSRDVAGFKHRGRQFVDVARALLRVGTERQR